MKKKEIPQEEVRKEQVSTRFLYGCNLALRMTAIGVRPVAQEIVLTRNGFGKGEAKEMIEQVKARWDRMTSAKQQEIMKKVGMRQFLRDTGLQRRR